MKSSPRPVKAVTPGTARERYLLKTYGITEDQYKELLKKQGDSCAVCLRGKETFPKNLAVDHNHVTGEIRGLLCAYCNHRLVGRHRNPDLLQRVVDYISQGTGWFVPKKQKKKRRKRKMSLRVERRKKKI